jgi:RNA polymerase primary sigma factor
LTNKADVLLADEAPIHELDELRTLIASGHERGFITIEEITTCLEEIEVTKEQVSELHHHLVDQGIDILGADGKPVAGGSEPKRDKDEDAGDNAPKKPEIDLTVEPSLDSLRLYLRSIGRVPLLTAQ